MVNDWRLTFHRLATGGSNLNDEVADGACKPGTAQEKVLAMGMQQMAGNYFVLVKVSKRKR